MAAELTSCPLCGVKFDAEAAGCTPSCPMAKGCSALCCPRCHYSFPKPSGLSALIERALVRLKTRRRA